MNSRKRSFLGISPKNSLTKRRKFHCETEYINDDFEEQNKKLMVNGECKEAKNYQNDFVEDATTLAGSCELNKVNNVTTKNNSCDIIKKVPLVVIKDNNTYQNYKKFRKKGNCNASSADSPSSFPLLRPFRE